MTDPKQKERLAHRRPEAETAWWKDMTGLVGEKDVQLAVIGPRSDATPDELRSLGQAIERWQAEFAPARHVWGLTDLLEGRCPRTPPIYLMVPFPTRGFAECYEPVALAYVAEGTNIEAAMKNLREGLSQFRDKLAWLEHPDAYSYYQR